VLFCDLNGRVGAGAALTGPFLVEQPGFGFVVLGLSFHVAPSHWDRPMPAKGGDASG
jgi:hypothetical protein